MIKKKNFNHPFLLNRKTKSKRKSKKELTSVISSNWAEIKSWTLYNWEPGGQIYDG